MLLSSRLARQRLQRLPLILELRAGIIDGFRRAAKCRLWLLAYAVMASPRLWRLARWAPAAALLGQSSSALSLDTRVPLTSSVRGRHTPTTVLVHGLDSSKQTWTGVLSKLHEASVPAVALDQRGHGESPLGDPDAFSTEALARDIIHAVEVIHAIQRPWILVGHSMGGKTAMQLALRAHTQLDFVLQRFVGLSELVRAGHGQRLGQKRPEGDRGRDGDHGGQDLERAFGEIGRGPDRVDREQVRGAAEDEISRQPSWSSRGQ